MTQLHRRIVVLLDGTALTEPTLAYASELARLAGARLLVVPVSHPHLHLLPRTHVDEREVEEVAASVEQQLERLQASGLAAELVVAPGATPDAVVTEIRSLQPDLVVMATRPHPGLAGPLLDGLADAMIAAQVAPVLLVGAAVPGGQSGPLLRGAQVLVPLDGSALGEAALPAAVELTRVLQGELVLFQTIPDLLVPYAVPHELRTSEELDVELAWDSSYAIREAQAYLQLAVDRLAREADGVHVRTEVRLGGLAEQIRRLQAATASSDPSARGLGLVVMAARPRHGLGRWLLGSTAAEMVQSVTVPVVAVAAAEPSEPAAALRLEQAA
jgi:nucleotide-binding universal stress UspA family protein